MLRLEVGLVLKILMNERQKVEMKKSVGRSLGRWEKRSTRSETEKVVWSPRYPCGRGGG